MNLAEALNAALPELPAKKARAGYPKLDPRTIWAENIEEGRPVVAAHVRGKESLFRFPPEQWKLIELFDGQRSYDDVAEAYRQLYGVQYTAEDVQEFANMLQEADFWYKTPQERNIALNQKLADQRHQHKHRKSKWGDIAHIQFSAWDPDRFFDMIYPRLRWVYTPWFTTLTLLLFAFTIYVFAIRWGEIGRDTLTYYTFTDKGARDLAEFWVLFLILAFFHESAHGLTCKHYGGQVHRMGFHLIFLTPAFFVDVTEAFVYASRWQRFVTILAGIWVETIFCALGTIVWWGTPPGTYVHELAYKILLITGVAVVVVNMNPLIKLDGYYAFSEIVGFADIKEKSTTYLSSWVRRHIFRLPVEVEYVSRRRRTLFVVYAILSGVYSYLLLFAVVRFSRNVFLNYSREWAFVPALALAFFIFRSRIRTFLRFTNTVYLDKKDRILAWLTPWRIAVFAVLLLAVLLLPVWPRFVQARAVLEPIRRETVRNAVPGTVMAVYVREGDHVVPGQSLVQLQDSGLESRFKAAETNLAAATSSQIQAQLNYGNTGEAAEQSRQYAVEARTAGLAMAGLTPIASITGVVMNNGITDLKGTYLDAGSTVAEIADTSAMRARLFVPEFDASDVHPGQPVRLLLEGSYSPIDGRVDAVLPASTTLAAGLESATSYKGLANTKYYVAEAYLPHNDNLRDQMSGTAKIRIGRQSIAGLTVREVRDFVGRKVW
ncbi:MAG: HlyD family efflux transporter periplasmic adaptor subunit [Candidatus Korobacteraceae bacterium]|jgi:putative peptide zinc metalloprotease protein